MQAFSLSRFLSPESFSLCQAEKTNQQDASTQRLEGKCLEAERNPSWTEHSCNVWRSESHNGAEIVGKDWRGSNTTTFSLFDSDVEAWIWNSVDD